VVTFLDAASEKTLRSTVALTASRGRGKVRPAGERGPPSKMTKGKEREKRERLGGVAGTALRASQAGRRTLPPPPSFDSSRRVAPHSPAPPRSRPSSTTTSNPAASRALTAFPPPPPLPPQSAALGLAIAGALALGYSNIFVTAPSPENTRTLFEFVFKASEQRGVRCAGPVLKLGMEVKIGGGVLTPSALGSCGRWLVAWECSRRAVRGCPAALHVSSPVVARSSSHPSVLLDSLSPTTRTVCTPGIPFTSSLTGCFP
jgi:hypothetical protein